MSGRSTPSFTPWSFSRGSDQGNWATSNPLLAKKAVSPPVSKTHVAPFSPPVIGRPREALCVGGIFLPTDSTLQVWPLAVSSPECIPAPPSPSFCSPLRIALLCSPSHLPQLPLLFPKACFFSLQRFTFSTEINLTLREDPFLKR